MKKVSSLIICVLFIFGISLPSLLWVVSDTKEISDKEKRRLAQLPELRFDKSLFTEYPKQFEAFFNDHFGLKATLVDSNRIWQDAVFNKSAVRRIVQGEQGWMFLDVASSVYDHVELIELRENVLPDWKQNLMNKKEWLNSLGIEYLFVPVPNKMTIYPEYLPNRISKHSGSTMLDKLFMQLDAGTPFKNYVNLETFLTLQKKHDITKLTHIPEKNQQRNDLYFHRDSHWTSLGAFLSYQHIIEQLQDIMPEQEPAISFDQLISQSVEKKGDIARMGSLNRTELHQQLVIKAPCSIQEPEVISNFKETEAYKLKPKVLPSKRSCQNKSGRAVVVHDSFGVYLQPFFAESFKEVVFMPSYNLLGMESFLREFKPDIYIDIRVERNVKYLLAPDKRLDEAVANLK